MAQATEHRYLPVPERVRRLRDSPLSTENRTCFERGRCMRCEGALAGTTLLRPSRVLVGALSCETLRRIL